jgi:hypothetical protein
MCERHARAQRVANGRILDTNRPAARDKDILGYVPKGQDRVRITNARVVERDAFRANRTRTRGDQNCLFDDDGATPIEGSQFRRTLTRQSRPYGDKVISFCHKSFLDFNLPLSKLCTLHNNK